MSVLGGVATVAVPSVAMCCHHSVWTAPHDRIKSSNTRKNVGPCVCAHVHVWVSEGAGWGQGGVGWLVKFDLIGVNSIASMHYFCIFLGSLALCRDMYYIDYVVY